MGHLSTPAFAKLGTWVESLGLFFLKGAFACDLFFAEYNL